MRSRIYEEIDPAPSTQLGPPLQAPDPQPTQSQPAAPSAARYNQKENRVTVHYDQVSVSAISTLVASIVAYTAWCRWQKRLSRQHTCGNKKITRVKKMEVNNDPGVLPGSGHYKTYVFGYCPRCDQWYVEKTENKRFSERQLRRRMKKNPEQFRDLDVFLKLAGIVPRGFTSQTLSSFQKTIVVQHVPEPKLAVEHRR